MTSIIDTMQNPDFRKHVALYDRMGAVRAFLAVRYPGHEVTLDYTHSAIDEANMYTSIAISEKLDEVVKLEKEMR
jgi:hypothetical protein